MLSFAGLDRSYQRILARSLLHTTRRFTLSRMVWLFGCARILESWMMLLTYNILLLSISGQAWHLPRPPSRIPLAVDNRAQSLTHPHIQSRYTKRGSSTSSIRNGSGVVNAENIKGQISAYPLLSSYHHHLALPWSPITLSHRSEGTE